MRFLTFVKNFVLGIGMGLCWLVGIVIIIVCVGLFVGFIKDHRVKEAAHELTIIIEQYKHERAGIYPTSGGMLARYSSNDEILDYGDPIDSIFYKKVFFFYEYQAEGNFYCLSHPKGFDDSLVYNSKTERWGLNSVCN